MRRMVPDKDKMQGYLDRGLTHAQIAKAWEEESGNKVHRTTISAAVSRYGLGGRRPRYDELIPWSPISADPKHNYNYNLRMLRLEARRRAGDDLDDEQLGNLRAWKDELKAKNAVIAYRYDSPDGFYAVPREPDDGELIEKIEEAS